VAVFRIRPRSIDGQTRRFVGMETRHWLETMMEQLDEIAQESGLYGRSVLNEEGDQDPEQEEDETTSYLIAQSKALAERLLGVSEVAGEGDIEAAVTAATKIALDLEDMLTKVGVEIEKAEGEEDQEPESEPEGEGDDGVASEPTKDLPAEVAGEVEKPVPPKKAKSKAKPKTKKKAKTAKSESFGGDGTVIVEDFSSALDSLVSGQEKIQAPAPAYMSVDIPDGEN